MRYSTMLMHCRAAAQTFVLALCASGANFNTAAQTLTSAQQGEAAAVVVAAVAVTPETLAAAQLATYQNLGPERLTQANRLAQALTADTDPRLILDVIDLQLRARLDSAQSSSLARLAMAGVALAQATGDRMRLAQMQGLAAETVFWSDDSDRGFKLALAALNAQRAVASSDAEHPVPNLLHRQYLRYAAMLQSKESDDLVVGILKQAEALVPRIDNPDLAHIATHMLSAGVSLSLGDHNGALSELDRADALAQRFNYARWRLNIGNKRAEVNLELGRLTEAETHYTAVLQAASRQNNNFSATDALSQLAFIAYLRNDSARRYQLARDALAVAKSLDDGPDLAYASLEFASAAAAMPGRVAEARQAFANALRISLEPRSVRRQLAIASTRIEINAAAGDWAALREALREESALRTAQELKRRQLQTRVAQAVYEVKGRELKMQLLEKQNESSVLRITNAEQRVFWQQVLIVMTASLLLVSLFAGYLLSRRAKLFKGRTQTDSLTEVQSRSAILDFARASFAEAKTNKHIVSACVLDFDRFKSINDEHGHEAGDIVLHTAANVMKQTLRAGDAIGRVGGDEFLIIMQNADLAVGNQVAERICAAVRNTAISHAGIELQATVTVGVASSDDPAVDSAAALIRAADAVLLAAKRKGRSSGGAI
jgi:diguanylate cyclase (GGDEF)-like protein